MQVLVTNQMYLMVSECCYVRNYKLVCSYVCICIGDLICENLT